MNDSKFTNLEVFLFGIIWNIEYSWLGVQFSKASKSDYVRSTDISTQVLWRHSHIFWNKSPRLA